MILPTSAPKDQWQRSRLLKKFAQSIGFELVGVASAEPAEDARHLWEWLDSGFHGSMDYMERNVEIREDARNLLDGARSVLCCGLIYNTPYETRYDFANLPGSRYSESHEPDGRLAGAGEANGHGDDGRDDAPNGATGWVSRYAWGRDYHKVMRKKLKKLAGAIESWGYRGRPAVDTAPILERSYAQQAGIGWIGKNTCLIDRTLGSWFFIGVVVTDLELALDSPVPDRCGSCTRCIEACPTDAIREAHVLDSRRCISYLTIENRGLIDPELAPEMGDHLFGCDICQEVCPYNSSAPMTNDEDFWPRSHRHAPSLGDLAEMLQVTDNEEKQWDAFDLWTRGSPIRRAKHEGFLRNLLVAARNAVRKAEKDGKEATELRQLVEELSDSPFDLVRKQSEALETG